MLLKCGKFFAKNFCESLKNRQFVQLAGRPRLPGSQEEGFPKYLNGSRENFPHILYAENGCVDERTSPEDCALAIKSDYSRLLRQYGALLLRGFPLGDPSVLRRFFSGFEPDLKPMGYQSGVGIRTKLHGVVYTASNEPREFSIEPHNEMAYRSRWPTVIVFACVVPAREGCGGETVLVNSRDLYQNIDRDIIDTFEIRKGVRYHHHYKEDDAEVGHSWKQCFETEDKAEVIEFLKSRRISHYFDNANSLTYWNVRPSTIKHRVTGELLWFNQATSAHGSYFTSTQPDIWVKRNVGYDRMPYHTYFGDGTDIPLDYIKRLRNVTWSLGIGFQLQKNDVLFLDNEMIQHGRMSFTGDRKLLVALFDDTS